MAMRRQPKNSPSPRPNTKNDAGPGGLEASSADWPGRAGPAPEAQQPMSAQRTGGQTREWWGSYSYAAACAAQPGRTCDVRRADQPRAMSRREPAANASSSGVAPRRSSTGSRGAERTVVEDPSRRGRVGSKGAGGGWREPAGATAAAGCREPPMSFLIRNDVVGAVIGERGPAGGRRRGGSSAGRDSVAGRGVDGREPPGRLAQPPR